MARAADPDAHRVHGMGEALEAPVWPPITAAEAAAVIARFPAAGRFAALRWHSPRPFSAAALIDTDRGALLLKRHHRSIRSVAALAEEHRFIAHLADVGLPVPQGLASDDGARAVAIDSSCYELHVAAPGIDLYRERQSWTPYLSHDHAYAAGVMLARLHEAARDYTAPPRAAAPLIASYTILPAPDPLAAARAYVAARPRLAAFLATRPWQEQLAAVLAQHAGGLAERLADQPSLWTHNDWHPSNLLWTPQGTVRTVIDFGLADRSCAVQDIATAIERMLNWLDLPQTDAIADPAAVTALLAGYAAVRPLGAADRATIARLLPLSHLEFALSEADYFTAVVDDPAAAALAWDGYAIGHVGWFATPPGRALLATIRGTGG